MATRQYIGARYVIKVYENTSVAGSAEWQSGTSYEPLTLVTYQNSSYLSKKAVPQSVGDPASNTSYWAVTGYYNGQIASLQSAVSDLESDLDALNINVGNGDIICVTDSYGNYPSADSNWITQFNSIIPNTCRKAALSGAGFGGPTNGTFLTALQNVESAITNPNEISTILVVGGRNDFQYTSQAIMDGVSAFASYCATQYPNAMVYVFYVGMDKDPSNQYDLQTRVMPLYQARCSVYKNMCYVMGSELIFRDYTQLVDMVHPNLSGASMIARGVKGALQVGNPLHTSQEITTGTIAYSSDAVVDSYTALSLSGFIEDNIVHIASTGSWTMNITDGASFAGGQKVGEITFPYLRGVNQARCKATIPVGVKMPDIDANRYFPGAGELSFYDGDVRLRITHSGNVTSIIVPDFAIEIATKMC